MLAPSGAAAQSHPLARVSWLVGCWERTVQNRRAVERWFAPRRSMMLGTSQSIRDGVARETEQLRLVTYGDTLVYDAHPASQARTQFRAREVGATRLVFANPDHDFPQQISYTLVAPDSLVAVVEGDRAGRRPPQTFQFRRAECGDVDMSPSLRARAELEALYGDLDRADEQAFTARYDWFGAYAAPGYAYVRWALPGSEVTVTDPAALRDIGQRIGTSLAQLRPRAPRYAALMERVRAAGDTAEVLVSGRLSYRFTDDAGRFGTAGREHERGTVERWIDSWVRHNGAWRLVRTWVFSDEVFMDGRVIVRDGRPLAAEPR